MNDGSVSHCQGQRFVVPSSEKAVCIPDIFASRPVLLVYGLDHLAMQNNNKVTIGNSSFMIRDIVSQSWFRRQPTRKTPLHRLLGAILWSFIKLVHHQDFAGSATSCTYSMFHSLAKCFPAQPLPWILVT